MTKRKNEKYNNENFTYYEYIFDTQSEQLRYCYPENEEPIHFSTGVHDKKYYTLTKQYNNFISKIRALTEKNSDKTFSQKHTYLANEIQKAASKGYNACWFTLSSDEIADLRAEGFEVEEYQYHYCAIKW